YYTAPYPMKQGDKLSLHANTFTSNGGSLTDRAITWVTTNSRVVSISSSGADAVAQAVGSGTAIISAVSEGQVSPSITITVTAVCCQIGEGATTTAQQAMQDAITRDQLSIQLPVKAAAQRAGAGYTQQVTSTGTPAVSYLLTKADVSPTAYVVTGDILTRY